MIAVPAIDLRYGRAVQLVGGVPGSERVSVPDPLAVAARWVSAGFTRLHIVDLDGALDHGENRDSITGLIGESGVPCQVGGGVRDDAAVADLLDRGAETVVVGTRAIEDGPWLRAAASRWPGRLVVAADVRHDQVVTRGWTNTTDLAARAFVETLDDIPLAGILVTDVGREGRQQGIDMDLFADLAMRTRHPVQAAGGVTSATDLRSLRDAGIARAVLGMALYTGTLDPITTAREFGA